MKGTPNFKHLARRFGRSERCIHQWHDAGAPLHDPKKLRVWLASRKQTPHEITGAPDNIISTTIPATAGKRGAQFALQRLEGAECAAFEDVVEAAGSGDPLALANARKSWLALVESLRRIDAGIESGRRAAGELRPTSELLEAAHRMAFAFRTSTNILESSILSEVFHLDKGAWEIIKPVIHRLLTESWLATVVQILPDEKLTWITPALIEQVREGLRDDSDTLLRSRLCIYNAVVAGVVNYDLFKSDPEGSCKRIWEQACLAFDKPTTAPAATTTEGKKVK